MYRGKYVSYVPTDCGCVFLDMLTSEKQNTRYSVKVRTFCLILTNLKAFLGVQVSGQGYGVKGKDSAMCVCLGSGKRKGNVFFQ